MRWRVEVSDFKGGTRLLRDVLKGLSIRLIEDEGRCFLESGEFEALKTPAEVYKYVSRAQSIIEEIGGGDLAIQITFKIDNIIEETEAGGRRAHTVILPLTGVLTLTGHAPILTVSTSSAVSEDERRRLDEEQKEREYQQLRHKAVLRIVSAFRDDRALQVQRLLQRELTPQTMGHIVELIQADIGGAIKGLVSDNQLERFQRSINHPEVFGEQARHIVSNAEPPPNPMGLEEARTFVRDLVDRWLSQKLDRENGDRKV